MGDPGNTCSWQAPSLSHVFPSVHFCEPPDCSTPLLPGLGSARLLSRSGQPPAQPRTHSRSWESADVLLAHSPRSTGGLSAPRKGNIPSECLVWWLFWPPKCSSCLCWEVVSNCINLYQFVSKGRTAELLVLYPPTSHLQPCSPTDMPGEWVPLSQDKSPVFSQPKGSWPLLRLGICSSTQEAWCWGPKGPLRCAQGAWGSDRTPVDWYVHQVALGGK